MCVCVCVRACVRLFLHSLSPLTLSVKMGVTEEAGSRCINIRWAINHLKEVKVSGKDNANITLASGRWEGAGRGEREGGGKGGIYFSLYFKRQ